MRSQSELAREEVRGEAGFHTVPFCGTINSELQVRCQELQIYSQTWTGILTYSYINDHFPGEGFTDFLKQNSFSNSISFFIVNMFLFYKDLVHFASYYNTIVMWMFSRVSYISGIHYS